MNLVFIYGPPAAGKLTVAEILSEKTGYKLLQNNITNLAAAAVFPFGSPPFKRIVYNLRLDIFREAAINSVDIIFTFVYALNEDDEYVKKIIDVITDAGGKVMFVYLFCPIETLLQRIGESSRNNHLKLTDRDELLKLMSRYNITRIPFLKSLSIDTSITAPEESARRIVEFYDL